MNYRTISVIALSNRDFPSFTDKLREAVQWMEIAAAQGAELVVLPEMINLYKGDGPGNPNAMSLAEAALDNWQLQTASLVEAATRLRLAVTVPVLVREGKHLVNSFFLLSRAGKVLGEYRKICPTQPELGQNVKPGKPALMEWEGIKVGGAICFDTNFQHMFESQAQSGAQLFLVPSLWPGGNYLNYYALRYSTPIALAYPAWSRIIDIDGTELVAGCYRHETLRFGFGVPVYTARINFDRVALHADYHQQKIIEIQRAYAGRVLVRFDQQNALFFLESVSPDLTVNDVMREFELTSVRDYLSQSLTKIQQCV